MKEDNIDGAGVAEVAEVRMTRADDTTERERAISEAERKYRDIFENAGEGIFQSTPDGRIIAANPALARIVGLDTPEEFIRSRMDIAHAVYVDPGRREEFKHLLEAQGFVRGFEHQAFRRDGSKVWVSVNARVVRDEQGQILYYEGTVQDINTRKLAEARSAAFATLARKLSGASTKLDAGRIIAETARELFGWDACSLDLYDADRDVVHPMLRVDTIEGRRIDITVSPDLKPTARSRRVIDQGPELELREDPIQFDKDAIPFGDTLRPSASLMTVPVRHASRIVGMFSIQSYTPQAYDAAALNDLQSLADHCGGAINRIHAEESLYESEERFRQMLHHLEDVVWLTDRDMRKVLYINPAYERIFRRTCESVYERLTSVIDAIHPEDRASIERMLEREGHRDPIEYRVVWPDGSVRWVLNRTFPIRNTEGEVYLVAGIAQDITDRKRAEEALKQSEVYFRSLIEEAADAISTYDANGVRLYTSPSIERVLGYKPEEMTGRSGFELLHPDDRQLLASLFAQEVQVPGTKVTRELRCRHKDGTWRTLESTGSNLLDNPAVGAVVLNSRDITERKRAEEALRESEERYRELFEQASDVIYKTDARGNWVAFNPAAVKLLKYGEEELTGKYYLDLVNPEYRSAVKGFYQEQFRTKTPNTRYEFPAIAKDGTEVWIEQRATLLFENDQAAGFHCVGRDTTERRRSEAALRESEERYRDLVENIQDLVCTHDLQGRVLSANRALEKLLGYDLKDFGEKTFREILAPESRDRFDDYLVRIRRDGVASGLMLVQTSTGERRIWEYHNTLRTEGVATPIVRSLARDVTDRRRAEAALRESETKFRTLTEMAPAVIFIIQGDKTIYTNAAAELQTGYTRDELLGMAFWEVVHPDFQDMARERSRARQRGEAVPSRYEVKICTKDNRERWLDVCGSTIEIGGKPAGLGVAIDITERKEAEEDRSTLRRELELTMNSIEEGIHRVDLEGKIAFENPAGARMLGWQVHELLGKPAHVTMHDTRSDGTPYPKEECPIYATFEDGLTRHVADEVFWRQDGTSFPVEYTTAAMRNDRNEIVAAVVTFRDITERKRAEESMKLFRNLIDQSSDAIEVIDPFTFRFIDCNESACRSLGYSREEFLSRTVFDIDPKVNRATLARLDEEMKETGFATLESIHRRKDGTTFPVEVNVKLVKLEKVYRLAVVRDITGRKRAEKALRESEERYRELFENAKDAIYVHDLSGRYVSVNRAAEKLTGFTRAEILGKHYSNFVAPRHLKDARANLCQKLDLENETVYEVLMVTKDRQSIPVEVSSRLIHENGVAVGVQGVARDVTDRKRAQEALKTYSRRVIEAQEAERQHIARELHDEIGQVLTAVKINLQSVQRLSPSPTWMPPLDESIGIVDEALGRVRELSIELRPALLDDLGLSAALRWYVDRYAQRTGIVAEIRNGFENEGRLPRDLETACFRIAQEALTNVVRHAKAAHVAIQLDRSRERVVLTITDDGVGFDVQGAFRSPAATAALGLRGMEERVNALQGKIEIESVLKKGTCVRAIFPLQRKQ